MTDNPTLAAVVERGKCWSSPPPRSATPSRPAPSCGSDGGTIACRHFGGEGLVFGENRTFPWSALALPLIVLWPLRVPEHPLPADRHHWHPNERNDREDPAEGDQR